MKRHQGWLAAGLLVFAVLACNLSKNSNNSNNSNSNSNRNNNSNSPVTNRPANADVFVEQLTMAKDENGKPGDSTTVFEPSDHKIHCVMNLNKAKGGTKIRTVWVAADAEGASNQQLKSLDYTTNSFEKRISGYLTKTTDWPKGTYRVEVYVNGNLDKTIDYTVE